MEEDGQHQVERQGQGGRAMVILISGSLVYYHCAFRHATFLSLLSDVFLVILCSLAILGLLFRKFNISCVPSFIHPLLFRVLFLYPEILVPVDPLEWQISQDSANRVFARLANTVGAAESVLRVAASGHDKTLSFGVVVCLYLLSVIGRMLSGITVAYAGFIKHPGDARVGHDFQAAGTPASIESSYAFFPDDFCEGCSHVWRALTSKCSNHQSFPGYLKREANCACSKT
ncbi:hypothetical protein Cgig2_031202 [Carnegiea gigantea]|uniref:Reticulon domain-containing protein n=1 Tax=Carnegiea gigantea TaxID=171969 RepID=A0A9Q1KQ16_9CARY|nr:hypothetical protein Cgig2_031202 [Carnegiea gigantea]